MLLIKYVHKWLYHLISILAGNDVYFQYKAEEGNILYKEFFDRTQLNPNDEAVYQNVVEGLIQLQTEQVILHIGEGNLKGHFRSDPFWVQNIETFAKGRPEFINHILPKNSPLTPLLRKIQLELIESGTVDYLKIQWQGKNIPKFVNAEVMVLSVGQVIFVFIVMGGVFGLAGIIFFGEILHKKISNKIEEYQYRKTWAMTRKPRKSYFPPDLLKYPQNEKWYHY